MAELEGEALRQMNDEHISTIAQTVADSCQLVDVHTPLATLEAEYVDNPRPGFVPGIQYLSSKYSSFRRIRGDGNCFYRAFLFGYLEHLIKLASVDPVAWEAEHTRICGVIADSKDNLTTVGYSSIAIEPFWEVLLETLQMLSTHTIDSLEAMFRTPNGDAEYMVWYCRALSAGFMKAHPDQFLPFIMSLDDIDGTAVVDIDSFCRKEVEPMGVECEAVQIMALCESLRVGVSIEYLDGSPLDASGALSRPVFPDQVEPRVHLLYRPGHYDLLYPMSSE